MKLTKAKALIIIGILVVTLTIVAWAAYTMTSNTVNVPVTPQATLSLTVNGTTSFSAIQYDNVTLTATCSDGSFNGVVSFQDGSTPIGTATAVSGIAHFTYNVTAVKTYQFNATALHN
jgi:hypothetical protein